MFDELKLLQSDRVYLRNYLRHVQDTTLHSSVNEETRQDHTILFTLGHVLWADTFRAAQSLAVYVLSKQKKYRDQVQAGKLLPFEHASALVLLERHLKNLFEGQLTDLEALKALTKTFQGSYIFRGDGLARLETSREELFRTQPLLWSMVELQDKYRFSPRPKFYMAFMDHLMAGNAHMEKVRVDELLATHISNMTVIDDILAGIRYHRPQPDVAHDSDILRRLAEE